MKINFLLYIFVIHFISCNGIDSGGSKLESAFDELKPKVKLCIVIQPFEGLPKSTTDFIAEQLKEVYSGDIIVNNPIPFPKNALNYNKKRYRADSLIRYLGTLVKDGQLILGLSNKDISTTTKKNFDWGVMGLGYCPGKSCIASTSRIKGKNRLEKLFKVAIHELGHNYGLTKTTSNHCPNKTCLMRDADGKDDFDQLQNFCSKCKPVLINAGWKF